VHDLPADAVDFVERGPQRLVPRHQVLQRRGERGPVERADQPQRHRAVVFRLAGLELAEKPQALLREGHR